MIDLIWRLIYEFFTTGLFAVGGGLATVPFLEQMGVRNGWFSASTLSTMIAVSESTPGPMGINMATYVGYTLLGIPGAIIATLSEVAPSIIVITLIYKVMAKFKESKTVVDVFDGIKPCVVAFIIAAVFDMFVNTLFSVDHTVAINELNVTIYAIMLLIYWKWNKQISPILIIVASALIGIVVL